MSTYREEEHNIGAVPQESHVSHSESPLKTHMAIEPPAIMVHMGIESPPHKVHMISEQHTMLDTIQEDKEGSLSGESYESTEPLSPLNSYENNNIPNAKEYKPEENGLYKEEKKIKLHWINEDEEEDEVNEEEHGTRIEYSHPDIDRGWAWMVLLATFLIFVLQFGLLSTTSLYYVQMLNEFGHSRSYTAWMGSLINAFLLLTGPISSLSIKRFGCRISMIIGSLLMVAGYLMSAIASSLPFIFFSYGIVVACGMSFVYSGMIITLAQYFCKKHSFATSIAMLGSGTGMFVMIRLMDYIIGELGWRNSFIICAGIALQITVCASLIFPLKLQQSNIDQEIKNMYSQEEMNSLYLTPIGKRMLYNEDIRMNRSVSSLRLSLGAGYLSSSFTSLNNAGRSGGNLGSNQHSFCSRGIGSNQPSFLFLQNSHSELGGWLPSLRSNQHSFGSRGSFYGIHSLRSNPQSFSMKSSQADLHHQYQPQLIPLKDEERRDAAHSPKTFGKMTKSQNLKNEKYFYNEIQNNGGSKCCVIFQKMKNLINGTLANFNLDLLLNSSFWFLNLSMFFITLATVKLFIIYKELSGALGFGDYFSSAISFIGLGDMMGRVSAGLLSSTKWCNPIVCCSISMLLCGVFIGLQILANSGAIFLLLTGLFGFVYGYHSVLITIVPAVIFGKEMLVTVFGYALFFAGFGALFGAPLAGFIVDQTGNYTGVLLVSTSCSILSSMFMFLCFLMHRKQPDPTQESLQKNNCV